MGMRGSSSCARRKFARAHASAPAAIRANPNNQAFQDRLAWSGRRPRTPERCIVISLRHSEPFGSHVRFRQIRATRNDCTAKACALFFVLISGLRASRCSTVTDAPGGSELGIKRNCPAVDASTATILVGLSGSFLFGLVDTGRKLRGYS